jgi:hypothetical protein
MAMRLRGIKALLVDPATAGVCLDLVRLVSWAFLAALPNRWLPKAIVLFFFLLVVVLMRPGFHYLLSWGRDEAGDTLCKHAFSNMPKECVLGSNSCSCRAPWSGSVAACHTALNEHGERGITTSPQLYRPVSN